MQVGKKTTTAGLGPAQLAEILGEAMDVDCDGEAALDQKKADFLRLRLDGGLVSKSNGTGPLSAGRPELCEKVLPLEGGTIGHILLDGRAPLGAVGIVKDYGRKLSGRRDREVEHAAGVAIYYAAIASALAFHGKRITRWSFLALAEALRALMKRQWMAPELLPLFSRAEKLCRKKAR